MITVFADLDAVLVRLSRASREVLEDRFHPPRPGSMEQAHAFAAHVAALLDEDERRDTGAGRRRDPG